MGRTMMFAAVAMMFCAALAVSSLQRPGAPRTPVIVELFTSEGCSSCPPADALLIRLERLQPVANAQVIVLGEHVDYWDHQGWTDPFSSPQFSRRQSEYAEAFGHDGIYTPQLIVDGQAEFNGTDASRAQSEIARAAAQPKVPVTVASSTGTKPSLLRVSVQVGAAPHGVAARDLEALLAVAESNLSSDVPRGENSGRKIQHTGVVRILKSLGRVEAPKSLKTEIRLPGNWQKANLTLVVFLQSRASRRIVGAGTVKLADE